MREEIVRRQWLEIECEKKVSLIVSLRRQMAISKRTFRSLQLQNRRLRLKLAPMSKELYLVKRQLAETDLQREASNTVRFSDMSGELEREL